MSSYPAPIKMASTTISNEQCLSGYTTEYWLSDQEAQSIAYADYWNDENAEADKDWNIQEKGFGQLEAYLADSGHADDIRQCLRELPKAGIDRLRGVGIDLAAGCLWAAPILLESDQVTRLYCLEFSKHRLLKLGPTLLRHYGVSPSRVTLVFGSFYDLKVADGSLDFALLASAFHHADSPDRLLQELRRVVKPGGVVMVTGEPKITWIGQHFKYFAKLALARIIPGAVIRTLLGRVPAPVKWPPSHENVFPPDPLLGDHLLTPGDYDRLFRRNGFRFMETRAEHTRVFILIRNQT